MNAIRMTRRANVPLRIVQRVADGTILQFAVSSAWEKLPKPPGFRLEMDFQVPSLPIGAMELNSLLNALLSNAVTHHDLNSGCVQVTSSTDGAFTCLTVSDDGPGIAPQLHGKVFEDSADLADQADASLKSGGLPGVQQIVDVHEGHVDIAPTLRARGTTVRVWIPSSAA